jgi:hypothetical protein
MTERLAKIGKRGNEWLDLRFKEAKKAYKDAIKDIKETERIRAADPGKVLRSAKQKFKEEVEELEAQSRVIEGNIQATKKVRTDLQTALYKAIGKKNDAAIAEAKQNLKKKTNGSWKN